MFEYNDDGDNGKGGSTGSSGMRIMEEEYLVLSTDFIKKN
jgi:hypothetical protein